MISLVKDPKQRKKIEATARRLCRDELARSGAQIDILDLGKFALVAEDAIASGRTQEGVREALREWLSVNRKDHPTPPTRTEAHDAGTKLGHIVLVQGYSAECPRCGASGALNGELTGVIFTTRCGVAS